MGKNVRHLWRGLAVAFADEWVRTLMTMTVTLIGIASVFYWYFEGWTLLDSVYFSVITIATVGYGDFYPQTVPGKLFTIGYIFCGLGLFVATATSIADRLVRAQRSDE